MDPERNQGALTVGSPSQSSRQDPWGVRRAEVLLGSLKGVKSARVVVSPDGEITEIHVLTEPGLTPKQVVRNVESALLAQLGIKVDHRKISVAQTTDVVPIEPAAAERSEDLTTKRRGVLFQRIDVSTVRRNRVKLAVTLEHAGDEVTSEEESADTPTMRIHAAARAAVAALDDIVDKGTVDLVGVQFVDAFDTRFVFVGVSILTGRETWLHTGTCEVKRDAEQAAVLAVLDATNRWVMTMML
jgi:hypothetical protein